jgi:aspartate beta-hydroxylase
LNTAERTGGTMTEQARLLGILDSARNEHGAGAVGRLERPIRAAAGVEEMEPTGDPLRRPHGVYIPGLRSAPWHDRGLLPDVALLEAAAPDMRAELHSLLASGTGFQPFDEGEYGFTPDNVEGAWNVFYLMLAGREAPGAAAACPKTTAALRALPNLATSAMISALTPGTHLWAHCGPTNAVVSLSMGLIAPPGCTIRVGTEERTWREGECLVFDDTYEHEVWHRGQGTRFVMLLAAWHPELTPVERRILEQVLWSPGEVEALLQKGQAALRGTRWW